MFNARIYRSSGFRFSDEPGATHSDKLRGLVKFGPYRGIQGKPKIGFVFPEGYRDHANNLYLALRNGIGYFKGLGSWFRVPFEKDQVFPVTGFKLLNPHDDDDCAKRYRDAILNWRTANPNNTPDVFLNLHPKSLAWEETSAYVASKAALLEAGIISQNVTFELMENAAQFEWAAANIALGLFVKLGGIPWITDVTNPTGFVIIGMGRAEVQDPVSRERARITAFTTCVRENGIYELTHVGQSQTTDDGFLNELKTSVKAALLKALQVEPELKGIVLHFPKDFARIERDAVAEVVSGFRQDRPLSFYTLKISEEERFFAFDDSNQGIPPRGACIKLDRNDFLLYTEGAEEKAAWANRLPTAVHIRQFGECDDVTKTDLVAQAFDLSLVNYRGFNSKAFPISIYYSELIANILKRGKKLDLSAEILQTRMWFL